MIVQEGESDLTWEVHQATEVEISGIGPVDTVRNMPRSFYPRLDALEALCRALDGRLEIVPVSERRK